MKKKQRCLIKRFSALVAAIMLCAALCVPCLASNNASTRKWVVTGEATMTNESGTDSRYLHVSPYENGALYRTRLITECASTETSFTSSGSTYYDWWAAPVNYPDWWRSDLPLGSRSYLQVDDLTISSWSRNSNGSYTSGDSFPSSGVQLLLVNPDLGFSLTRSYTSSALSLSQELVTYPVLGLSQMDTTSGSDTQNYARPTGMSFSSSSRSGVMSLEYFSQLVLGFNPFADSSNTALNFTLSPFNAFYNADSSHLIFLLNVRSWCTSSSAGKFSLEGSAVFSYWIDANKLPAGLQVGDEFPANNDAFESLREGLLEQFPEASENVENGKTTLTGWNDTETVDTDVASTAMSALNAMFQNLGSFLFIISLMVFGAVVLRMFIKKAVDG